MTSILQIDLSLVQRGFQLQVQALLPAAGVTVIFGQSGSGKTTLLRCVAGLERGRGTVRLGDETWQEDRKGIFLKTHRRDLGYVFQEASLFDHLSIRQNLAYGLQRAQKPWGDGALAQAVELLGIGHLLDRRPPGLSGGERQRVAIARALATQPRLLLLDEPLAALDIARRSEVLPWLEGLQQQIGLPVLYVTHSADELVRMADHVLVLDAGRIIDSGPIARVLQGEAMTAQLNGEAINLLEGRVVEFDHHWKLARVATPPGLIWVPQAGCSLGQRLRVRVPGGQIRIVAAGALSSASLNSLPATIADLTAPRGDEAMCRIHLRTPDGSELIAVRSRREVADHSLQTGQSVHLEW